MLYPFAILGLVLVVWTASPQSALAFSPAPGPISLFADTAKAAPVRVISRVPGPWSLALNTAAFGAIAYAERDSWMPYATDAWDGVVNGDWGSVKETFSDAWDAILNAQQNKLSTCQGEVSISISANKYTLAGAFAGNGCDNLTNPAYNQYYTPSGTTEWACRDQAGNESMGSQVNGYPRLSDTTGGGVRSDEIHVPEVVNGNATRIACPAGHELTYIKFPPMYWGVGIADWQGWVTNGVTAGAFNPDNGPDDKQWTPQRNTITTNVTCRNAVGDTVQISGTIGGPASTEQIPVPSCEAELGSGWHGEKWEVTESPDYNPSIKRQVETYEIKQNVWDQYPDCRAGCRLRVFINGQPCTVGDPSCVEWQTYQRLHPDQVECKWGAYSMPIADCLQIHYDGKTRTYTKPGDGTDPRTGTDADPATNPDTGSDPGTSPDTGTTTIPGPEPKPENTTTDSGECFPSGWNAFNPVEWVYMPMKCALKWAFVPEVGIQPRVEAVKTDATTRIPFTWVGGTVTAVGASSSIGQACPGWTVHVGPVDQGIICDTSFSNAIVGARPWLAGGLVVAALWPLVRGLFYASVPIVKPSPGGH